MMPSRSRSIQYSLASKRLPQTFICCLIACGASLTTAPGQSLNRLATVSAFHCQPPFLKRQTVMTAPNAQPKPGSIQTRKVSSTTHAAVANNNNNQESITTPIDPLEALGLPRPLILGSGSFTRKLILKEMGVDYHLLVRSIDERNIGDREKDEPHSLVLTLAKAKADHLVSEMQNGNADQDLPSGSGDSETSGTGGWIILTADQVVTHAGSILEKPLDIQEAKSFVSGYGTSAPQTVGACVLTHVPSGIQVSGVDSATIVFRSTVGEKDENGNDLIDRLLADDAPVLKCAGGLMVEHPFVREHLERIDGTEDSVMGLSKDLVDRLLKELKTKLMEQKLL